MKKLILPLITAAVISFTSCDVASYFRGYDIVAATEAKTWNYDSANPIFEVTPDVLSVTINNIPAGKKLYLVKRNIGNETISIGDTRTITNASRSAVEDEDTLPEFSLPDSIYFGQRKHFVGHELPSINSSSSRAAAGISLKTTSVVKTYTKGDKKDIYIDVNKDINTFEERSATLCAVGNKCYVWIVDDYYGLLKSGNKTNSSVAEKFASAFDDMYPIITNIFGAESNKIVDYDAGAYGEINNYSDTGDKINIVIYDIANDYKNSETVSTGGIIGYFSPKDYYYTENTQYGNNSVMNKSNVGKYFYIDSAYANVNINDTISTLAHEFQHMINFNQKNVKWDKTPSVCYNEMLSMLCEDMMQKHLGLEDYDSPKNRIQGFNAYYYMSGITEYRNDSYFSLSYATSYAFGSWLARQYGGADLVKQMMNNSYVDNDSIVDAVNKYNQMNGKTISYTFEDLFKQFLLAITGDTTCTHNQDAANPSTVISEYSYPMKAFNIFDSKKISYRQNGKESIYSFSLKNLIADSSTNKTFESMYGQYAYSGYDWNGPFVFSSSHGPTELRSNNGISIHGIETTTAGSKTYTFTQSGANTLNMYLIIE